MKRAINKNLQKKEDNKQRKMDEDQPCLFEVLLLVCYCATCVGKIMRRLIKEKWIYYKGKAPATVYREVPFDFKLTTKEEVNMFIDADDDVRKLQYKIDYIEQVLFFLDGVLRQINSRNFQIKNAIEWEKFQAGM